MSTGKLLKLYGVPLSQPFRSCAWTMLQLEVPFQVEIAVPGMSSKVGSLHENYRSLTPHRTSKVPLLVDDAVGLAVAESPAILAHLCERHGRDGGRPPLYAPPGSIEKARIDSYTHWHHSNTRDLARVFQTRVRPDLKVELSEGDWERVREVLDAIDSGWLERSGGQYIGGSASPSIADVLAYGEISSVVLTGLVSVDDFPNLASWMGRMQTLPYYDEAHASLLALGDLTVEEPGSSIAKRLGHATKMGLQAITQAQEKYQKPKL